MTTRKQVMDAYKARVADEQQRAANGQFGSGGGASSRATSFAGNSAVAKKAQNASAKHSNIGREMVQAAANAKSPQYANTMRMGAVAAQNKSAAEGKKARQAMGISDACKGIKGILDTLDEQQRASNGQFSSGGGSGPRMGGKSVNISETPEAKKAMALYAQKNASEAGRMARFHASNPNAPAGLKTHHQNMAANASKAERRARGVEDACKGIKGILDALERS